MAEENQIALSAVAALKRRYTVPVEMALNVLETELL